MFLIALSATALTPLLAAKGNYAYVAGVCETYYNAADIADNKRQIRETKDDFTRNYFQAQYDRGVKEGRENYYTYPGCKEMVEKAIKGVLDEKR